jgi:hypothetical protein
MSLCVFGSCVCFLSSQWPVFRHKIPAPYGIPVSVAVVWIRICKDPKLIIYQFDKRTLKIHYSNVFFEKYRYR